MGHMKLYPALSGVLLLFCTSLFGQHYNGPRIYLNGPFGFRLGTTEPDVRHSYPQYKFKPLSVIPDQDQSDSVPRRLVVRSAPHPVPWVELHSDGWQYILVFTPSSFIKGPYSINSGVLMKVVAYTKISAESPAVLDQYLQASLRNTVTRLSQTYGLPQQLLLLEAGNSCPTAPIDCGGVVWHMVAAGAGPLGVEVVKSNTVPTHGFLLISFESLEWRTYTKYDSPSLESESNYSHEGHSTGHERYSTTYQGWAEAALGLPSSPKRRDRSHTDDPAWMTTSPLD